MKSLTLVIIVAGVLGAAAVGWRIANAPSADTADSTTPSSSSERLTQSATLDVQDSAPQKSTPTHFDQRELREETSTPTRAAPDRSTHDNLVASQSPAARWAAHAASQAAADGTNDTAEPIVPIKLAFRALWYVGIDPAAERTWLTAINDINMPEGVRSDLIEDLHDEGYTDNENPTHEDLPTIIARLELIERLANSAMDQVNADAFQEAYKDLLEKYVRLGGTP